MSCFSDVLKESDEYKALLRTVVNKKTPSGIVGLSLVHKAHFIHSLCDDSGKKGLVITTDEASAQKIVKDLNSMGSKALMYPVKDISFANVEAQSREYEQQRLGVLMNMLSGKYDVVVCSASACAQKTLPPKELKARSITLKVGQDIPIKTLKSVFIKAGYTSADAVAGPGQFAVRGGIVDFFPPHIDTPIRIELWGDTVDTMATFDAETQRRGEAVKKITITPCTEVLFNSLQEQSEKVKELANSLRGKTSAKAKEYFLKEAEDILNGVKVTSSDKYLSLAYEKPATIFDYLKDGQVFVCDSSNVKEKVTSSNRMLNEEIKGALEDGLLCRGLSNFTITFNELVEKYKEHGAIYVDNFARGSFDTPVNELYSISCQQLSVWSGTVSILKEDVLPTRLAQYTVVIFSGTAKAAKNLAEELKSDGYNAVFLNKQPKQFQKGQITVLEGSLSSGMDYPAVNFMAVTQGRHVDKKQIKKIKQKKLANSFTSLDQLHKGDYVVQATHGIGVFDGIECLTVSGLTKDYIKIKYAKSDVLYVPVTQLDTVAKYIGPRDESRTVKLNRIGGKEWEKAKTKVRGAVKDMAADLIELYSKRLNTKGFQFSKDFDMQNDFERRFPYDETDDQLRCIEEIKGDMEKQYPMDRLLCGDVGFGKTEVALRAAFKCIAEGKQCAILVPTTILAFQHYQTIINRFEGFPIESEMLSRFRTAAQQKKIKDGLRRGSIDLIVGTHRLISKDIQFKDLGLLIVDEEQRFGVAQKEKLKEKFPNVDVLTLSATPIPRTLNMAMSGIRDMSVIEEAPHDRHPVQSYVLEYDEGVVVNAIEKELRRGGQVYYMHNKVETIARVANRLSDLMPDVRFAIAHGRMTEEELSEVWRKLLEGEIDVLVCTTIIETGVDVPNVNTLIIENADSLGLAQLHQIRGRIGRSSRRASAYFTFTRGKQISEIATRRLAAIREYTEFGSGFKIAMRDLELRGAGNILGAQQHGHMEAVGYDMYIKLLNEAVEKEKGNKVETVEEKECLIDVQIDAHIPDNYITSVPQKLAMYRRIAGIRTTEDSMDVIDELIDRYGEPPESVLGLVEVSLLRNTAASIGIHEIGQNGENLLLYSNDINIKAVSRLSQLMKGQILVSAGAKPYISVKVPPTKDNISVLKDALIVLSREYKKAKDQAKNKE